MLIKRGEIYWVEFDPVKGSEQGGLQPALIIQNNVGNQYGQTTVVTAITRTIPSKPYPFVVIVESEESGLPYRSTINCAQIATIQQSGKSSRLRPPRDSKILKPIGRLKDKKMAEVENAIKYNLSLK